HAPGQLEPPASLKRALAAALDARNLDLVEAAVPGADRVRDSKRRFDAVLGEAPFVLLVELQPAFFSQLNGRNRWTVYARLSAARRGAEPAVDAFDVPVFLDFDHQREPEAVALAAQAIAERAGALFDSFLGTGAAPPHAQRDVGPIYFVMVDRFANGDRAND